MTHFVRILSVLWVFSSTPAIGYIFTASDIETSRSSAPKRILLAKNEEGSRKAGREKVINTEGTIKKTGDKTSIDFDAADISGTRRVPLGSMINQNRADKEYDLVKIRTHWHNAMSDSAASLDTK